MNKSFYVEEQHRDLINKFAEIHEIKQREKKAKGESIREISVSKTLVSFIAQYVAHHNK
jgi:hypothetical protein